MAGRAPQPQLTFEQALDVLQGMFDWPRPALAEMLKANKLNMELTVESILALGAPPPGLGESDATVQRRSPPPSTHNGQLSSGAVPRPAEARRGRVIKLPDDFLRVPGSLPDSERQQQLELDEQLALMLQDEMFVRELRREVPDFDAHAYSSGRRRAAQQHLSSGGAAAVAPSSEPTSARTRAGSGDIIKSIGDMGDSMKQRITDLYSRFVKRREGAGRRDQSHVPLMDEDNDEGEVVLFNGAEASGVRRRSGGAGHLRTQEFELGELQKSTPRQERAWTHDDEEEETVVIDASGGKRMV